MANEIIKVLDDLCNRFGIAIDWADANVIPYVEELMQKYISWEIAMSIATMAIPFVLFIIFCVAGVIANWMNGDLSVGAFSILAAVAAFVFIFCAIAETVDIITCIYFPEKQIIEYIQLLIESGK